jgi:hypothetical protein
MSATQRIHLNPNAPRGPTTGGYQPQPQSYRPNPIGPIGGQGGNEMLGQVQAWSSKVEDLIEAYTQVRFAALAHPGAARGGCLSSPGVWSVR